MLPLHTGCCPAHFSLIWLMSGQAHHHMEPVPQPLVKVWGSPAVPPVMGMIACLLFLLPCPKWLWASFKLVVLATTPPFIFTAQNHLQFLAERIKGKISSFQPVGNTVSLYGGTQIIF